MVVLIACNYGPYNCCTCQSGGRLLTELCLNILWTNGYCKIAFFGGRRILCFSKMVDHFHFQKYYQSGNRSKIILSLLKACLFIEI